MKKIYAVILLTHIFNISIGQGTWTPKANFQGISRWGAVSFTIGTNAYVGLGNHAGTNKNDFYKWDATNNGWSAIASFPGAARYQAVAFSIGNKGYVGTGAAGLNFPFTPFYSDFWQYDPDSNQWHQIASMPVPPRFGAVAFSIGNKGYVSTGVDTVTYFQNDLWEYDPALNQWSQKSSLPATSRMDAVGFSIGLKGYIGTGGNYASSIQLFRDLWEYNPGNDQWTQRADFGGTNRSTAVGFSVAGKGYIGLGGDYQSPAYFDFWEYDTTGNQWNQITSFTAAPRWLATGFSIGNKGYVTTGEGLSSLYSDLREYSPAVTGLNPTYGDGITFSIHPSPVSTELTIYNLQFAIKDLEIFNSLGKKVFEQHLSLDIRRPVINVSDFPQGIYFVKVYGEKCVRSGKFVKR